MNPNVSSRKKQYLIYGAIVGVLLLLMIAVPALFKKKDTTQETPPVLSLGQSEKMESESFKALYGTELTELKQRNEELQKRLEELQRSLEEERKKKLEVPLPPPPPPAPGGQMPYVPPSESVSEGSQQKPLIEPMRDLIVLEKVKGDKDIFSVESFKTGDVKRPEVRLQLPAGTIIKGVLLSGMDAPTGGNARSQPHPVLIKVTDLAILPNLFKSDIKECFVIGSGYGDLSSERAYIRTETLSCMTKDRVMIELPVKGYVTGEDGKVGLAGRVVTKQGQMLARALVAGFLEGVANAYKQANTIVQVSPTGTVSTIPPEKAAEAGLYAGAGSATQRLADFYMKLVNEMYPVIEINAGRPVDIVLTSGIKEKEEKQSG